MAFLNHQTQEYYIRYEELQYQIVCSFYAYSWKCCARCSSTRQTMRPLTWWWTIFGQCSHWTGAPCGAALRPPVRRPFAETARPHRFSGSRFAPPALSSRSHSHSQQLEVSHHVSSRPLRSDELQQAAPEILRLRRSSWNLNTSKGTRKERFLRLTFRFHSRKPTIHFFSSLAAQNLHALASLCAAWILFNDSLNFTVFVICWGSFQHS